MAMQLIGMLDSPYVRRTAISLRLLGLPFEHRALSVFSTFEQFKQINPVVKAPTLVCDDGSILLDSNVIISYAEALAAPHTLLPKDLPALQLELHVIGLALAACEKGVQLVYERNLRPLDKQHQPWISRVTDQLLAALRELNKAILKPGFIVADKDISQGMITTTVVWRFILDMLAETVITTDYPAITVLANAMEQLPSFAAYPATGPGVPRAV
jgi:glutathione S-transferase